MADRFEVSAQAAKFLTQEYPCAYQEIKNHDDSFLLPTGAKLTFSDGQWIIYGYACAAQDTKPYEKYRKHRIS